MEHIIEIDTSQIRKPEAGSDLFVNRAEIAKVLSPGISEVTVVLQAYNRLEKTKRCVESLLKYTKNVDYDLILIDNGSTDGTLEYFQSIDYEKKTIWRITKNVGAFYPALPMSLSMLGRYICFLSNDLILTENWLSNLLTCMKSDPRIGMVNPVSSNTSNLQCMNFKYSSYEEMQCIAKQFNQSNPGKWQDRLRLITIGPLYRRDALLCTGWPIADVGFFHDFGDDDVTFSIRRAGYRTVLAGDTWICHDHKLQFGEDKKMEEFNRSLEIGRKNFQSKYYGIDAWDDVNNYYMPFFEYLPKPKYQEKANVLGIDVKCGTPILDAKNWLRQFGIFNTQLSAFIQNPKYWLDLKTICDGNVICDREEFLADNFLPDYFDIIIADQPLNRYHEPQRIIDTLYLFCKRSGIILCRVKNSFNFKNYIHMLGQHDVYDSDFSYNIPISAVREAFSQKGADIFQLNLPSSVGEDDKEILYSLLPEMQSNQKQDILNNMLMDEYLLIITKR